MAARTEAAPANGTLSQGSEMTALLGALSALRDGDSSVRLPVEWTGIPGKVADAFNEIAELNERMTGELSRLRQSVGKEGRLSQRGALTDASMT
jgi:hypothetical protein